MARNTVSKFDYLDDGNTKVNLYMAKFNVSNKIYKVYDNEVFLEDILKDFYKYLNKFKNEKKKDFIYAETPRVFKTEAGDYEEYFEGYSLTISDLDDSNLLVWGYVIKDTYQFVKQVSSDGEETFYERVNTQEEVPYYFDVLNERIVFLTKNNFGRGQFAEAIGKLFNQIYCEYSGYDYESFCNVYCIHETKRNLYDQVIRENLKVSKFRYEIVAPNMPKSAKAKDFNEKSQAKLDDMKSGNIHKIVVVKESSSEECINMQDPSIKEEFEIYTGINENNSYELSSGYGKMTIMGLNGENLSDKIDTPLTRTAKITADKKISELFLDAASNFVRKVLIKS